MTLNIVSVRVGTKYSADYVLRLHDAIHRHACADDTELRHWCLTDDPDSLPDGITAIPHNPDLPGWWQKVYLFSCAMPWKAGESVLYMDLDVCVTGRLEGLPDGIIRDWHWPTYNSSVMKWKHGEHGQIWRAFTNDVITEESPALRGLLPKGQVNGGDQEWITEVSGWETFPPDYFVSYRNAVAWPPEGSKAIIFHGAPKPHEVTTGWVPEVWKVGGWTAVPELKGMNVTHDFAYDNVRANVVRDLPWFSGHPQRNETCVIVCGGPSMKDSVQAIKDHKRRGARIITVNNALHYLCDRGVKPHGHVMLDARPENAAFVENAPKDVRYFLASQVHPSVFDALSGHDVVVWHNGMGDGEALMEILQPWFDDGPNQKPVCLVPGGGTVGLRALSLAWLSGYRKVHIYGMDSSYSGTTHHAYAQPLNDNEQTSVVVLGDQRFTAAKWMIRQANEFQQAYRQLTKEGMKIVVHGSGLVPSMYRAMK